MTISLFTGAGGNNPIVFPDIMADLNALILKINARGPLSIPMLTADMMVSPAVMADLNQLIRLKNGHGTIPYFGLGGANPAVLLAAIPDLNRLINYIEADAPSEGGPYFPIDFFGAEFYPLEYFP